MLLPRIFTLEWCDKILEEIAHFEEWAAENKIHVHRPNSMNNYGTMLDDIGMSDALQDLAVRIVGPLAHRLLPDCGADSVDSYVCCCGSDGICGCRAAFPLAYTPAALLR